MFRLQSVASIQRSISNRLAQSVGVVGNQEHFEDALQAGCSGYLWKFLGETEGHNLDSIKLSPTCTQCRSISGRRNDIILELSELKTNSFQRRYFSTSQRHWSLHVDPKKDYYKELGVTPHCSVDKVKNAYYRLSKLYHPDVNKTTQATKKFHDITEAYEILSNTRLRRQYEEGRKHQVHGHHQLGQVSRGRKPPHSKNFKPTGPIQKADSPQLIHDRWMRAHYLEAMHENHEKIYEIKEEKARREENIAVTATFIEHSRKQRESSSHENSTLYFCIAWIVIFSVGFFLKCVFFEIR